MLRSLTNSRGVADALLRVGQMVSGPGFAGGLTWAQWTVLRYLARANSLSRTPSAFAAFHGTTRGTASQTIKSLIAGGYVVRTRSTADGRSARLDLTAKGWAVFAHDPAEDLTAAVEDLAPKLRCEVGAALSGLIASLARRRDAPPFGSCGDCRHRGNATHNPDGAPRCECRFTRVTLDRDEMERLCIHFQPARRAGRAVR